MKFVVGSHWLRNSKYPQGSAVDFMMRGSNGGDQTHAHNPAYYTLA